MFYVQSPTKLFLGNKNSLVASKRSARKFTLRTRAEIAARRANKDFGCVGIPCMEFEVVSDDECLDFIDYL